MFFQKKTTAPLNSRRQAATPKNIRLIREAWWLALVALGLYLAVILFTYHPADPSWSHSASDSAVVQNAGGHVGAWVSDMLLYLFGFSAWWWVVFAFYAMWLVYLRLETEAVSQRPLLLFNMVGFGLLLAASASLEAGHVVPLAVELPSVAGGMLGSVVDEVLRTMFGFAGSTLVLLVLFAIGFSLFTGWSWLLITEKLGDALIFSYHFIINAWQDRQDRRAGKQAELRRTEFVESERKRVEDRAPVQIEKPALEIPKSDRVEKERQTALFASLPDSALPPLHLLDEPQGEIELQSAETLDFTSRLIERKLMDFGIEVKVITALPGPVITRFELEPAAGVKGSQVANLSRDLARALSVVSVRVVETIPGKSYMGLEIPNPKRQIVYLSEILGSRFMQMCIRH